MVSVGTAASAQASVDTENMQSKVNVDKVEAVQNPKDAPTRSLKIAPEKSNPTTFIQVTANKSVQFQDLSAESDAKVLLFHFSNCLGYFGFH